MSLDWSVFRDWSTLLIVLQLIYLEGILSIDNAAVLGAMVAHLPRQEPIPWPGPLRFLQRPVHRVLGGQQMAALKVGLLGAYLGRGSMLFLAAWVVRNPWLLLLGGLYLIYLAVSHFGAEAEEAEAAEHGVRVAQSASFWLVVVNVELADMAFSLDNVVAAVALSRNILIIWIGVALGIITMRFAAGIFVRLIEREPVLETAAYLLVLAIGFQVIAEDLFALHISHLGKFLISLSILLGSILYARSRLLQAVGRRFLWVRRVLAMLSRTMRAIVAPLGWAVRGSLRAGIRMFNNVRTSVNSRRTASALKRPRHHPSPGGDGGP